MSVSLFIESCLGNFVHPDFSVDDRLNLKSILRVDTEPLSWSNSSSILGDRALPRRSTWLVFLELNRFGTILLGGKGAGGKVSGRSSGKTFGNSLTTGISSSLF
ncbi:hypothetical protein Tco_1055740 [Tanacetum coccineum]|uniref:Uncharacterized protein n=1 Tax=Tanacetum coccineum TaxID=301880 RepID=A0ABQ5H2U7_9ASTR